MPPDRFDDVNFRFLEQPEPPSPPRRPRRRGRRAVVALTGMLAVGALAAGASVGAADPARSPAADKGELKVVRGSDGVPVRRGGRGCRFDKAAGSYHDGAGSYRGADSSPRY